MSWVVRWVVAGVVAIFGSFGVALFAHRAALLMGWGEGGSGFAAFLMAACCVALGVVTLSVCWGGDESYAQLKMNFKSLETKLEGSQRELALMKEAASERDRLEKLKRSEYR